MLGNDPWLNNYLVLGAVLFSLGAVGFLTRRNLIVIFLCAELMLQGVSTTFVGFSSYHGTWGGQVGAIFSLALAAAEAGVALALFVVLFRRGESLDVSLWQTLRESEIAPIEDDVPTEGPDAGQPGPQWPKLSPAGRLPGVTQPSPTGSGSRTLAASPATREGVAIND
jgi:NADH-quinone oxidoreductase subunit K